MSQVFVSYSHRDERAARGLKSALADHGYDVWLAGDEIQPGDSVSDRVREGLRSANVVVLLIGKQPSEWARYEWSEALQRSWDAGEQARLIPVVLPGAEPPSFVGDEPLLRLSRGADWEDVVHALQTAHTTGFRWHTSETAQSELAERLKQLEAVAAALPDSPSDAS